MAVTDAEIAFLRKMNNELDGRLGLIPAPSCVTLTPAMMDAGRNAAYTAEVFPGDDPLGDHVILRIYLAMERQRVSGR